MASERERFRLLQEGYPVAWADAVLCSKRTKAMTDAAMGDTSACVCDDAAPSQEQGAC